MTKCIRVKLFKNNSDKLDTVYILPELKDYFVEQSEKFEARIICMDEGTMFNLDGHKYWMNI